MFTVPFALSIHKFINSIGADVGFASIIAVALLVLLYFAHARETATLRERLEDAQTRIGGLEARLAQMLNAQSAALRGRGPVPAPPVVAGQPGVPAAGQARTQPTHSAIPSVRRIPTATVAAGVATAAPATNGLPPLAPVGMAGPALASATKFIPTGSALASPPAAVAAAPDETMFVPAVANGVEPATGATQTLPPPAFAPALQGGQPPLRTPPAPSRGQSAPPPRVQLRPGETGEGPRRRRPASRSLIEEDFGRDRDRRLSGRLLPLLISAVAVVVIVIALIVITGSGSGTPTTAVVKHSTTSQTGASVTNGQHKAVPFNASKVQVAVLNGTAVAGLAADLAKVLTGDGYRQGNVTNAAVQTQTTTVVYYATGAHSAVNIKDAKHVASALSLPTGSVQPATQAALQSCATGPTGNALGSCSANVIVSVGSDRASLASSNAG